MQVAELGGENEQLQWELQAALQKQRKAETEHQLLHRQSDKSSVFAEQDAAGWSQTEELSKHNRELQSQLAAALQNLKQEKLQSTHQHTQHQQLQDHAGHTEWELQHQVDNLTQENQSLLKHHAQLETRFESLTKQLAKAQHAQHAQHAEDAQSKASEAREDPKTRVLQEQVDSLMASSAKQLEQRHRLENEVALLQRQLTNAESMLHQHQNRVRGHQQAEAASSGQLVVLQQQAESVAAENAALEAQFRQQAASMKQLQSDVQVSHSCS